MRWETLRLTGRRSSQRGRRASGPLRVYAVSSAWPKSRREIFCAPPAKFPQARLVSALTQEEKASFSGTASRTAGAGPAPGCDEHQRVPSSPASDRVAEHRALQEYFTTLARRYETDATEHAAFAAGLRTTRLENAAAIHSRLATLSRNAEGSNDSCADA